MTRPVYDTISSADRALVFCLKQFSIARTPNQKGICLVKDDVVQAACLYDWYNGSNVFMHCAALPGRKWLNRDFLYWAFHYPFKQLRVARVSLWLEANNRDSVRFAEHLGFTRETVLAGAGQRGVDVFIYVMKSKDCRYVDPKQQSVRGGTAVSPDRLRQQE